MVAWHVPVSEDFPNGRENTFQFMDADGDTLLRYDNSPYHLTVGRHLRHTPDGDITTLDFKGLSNLIHEFENEETEIHGRRTD